MSDRFLGKAPIYRWQDFIKRVRGNDYKLFAELPNFDRPILITGCQRSGTTMVSRIFAETEGMEKFQFGPDDELDAALILCGYVAQEKAGRFCFQTTYMYNQQEQYLENSGNQKIIWVVRNPYSVVYSMLYNWRRFALNELFEGCGVAQLPAADQERFNRFGGWVFSQLTKACYAYCGKAAELAFLKSKVGPDELKVVEYDSLIQDKNRILPALYEFVGLDYQPAYAEKIKSSSVTKQDKLSKKQRETIQRICEPAYLNAREYLDF